MMRCESRSRSTSARNRRKASTGCGVSSPSPRRRSMRSEIRRRAGSAVRVAAIEGPPVGWGPTVHDATYAAPVPGRGEGTGWRGRRSTYILLRDRGEESSLPGARFRNPGPGRGGKAMKAAYYETTGAPEVIKYGDLPTPEPKAGEVRVRVAAAALNPIDTYIRSGAVAMPLPK